MGCSEGAVSSVLDLLSTSTLTVVVINCLLAWSAWLPLSTGQLSMMTGGLAASGAYTTGWLLLRGVPLVWRCWRVRRWGRC
jgi:ABC-type branched-subunit amino acid transport system permease subunit